MFERPRRPDPYLACALAALEQPDQWRLTSWSRLRLARARISRQPTCPDLEQVRQHGVPDAVA